MKRLAILAALFALAGCVTPEAPQDATICDDAAGPCNGASPVVLDNGA